MAVQSDTSSITYTGNNSTSTSYTVPFVFLENSHLAAIAKVTATGVETPVTLVDHIGAGNSAGGNVRTAVAVPATSTLTIFRTVPATQTTSYQEGGDFPAASHERALDKLTYLAQQNERAVERSFRVTEGSGTKNEVVAVPNTLLGLDASNQPKALTVDEVKSLLAISGVTVEVDAGIKTFADAGERALAVPDFTGQLGTQRDTADIYISTGLAAGDWSLVDENMTLADFASGFFTADAAGRGKFASGFVDDELLRQSAPLSVVGRSADSSGSPADITAVNDGSVLRRSGTAIGFGQVGTSGIADAAITPEKLSGSQSGSAPVYGARAWVNFAGTSTVAINQSGNVTSITDHGTGSYSINFATAMPDSSYAIVATCRQEAATNQFVQIVNSATSATPLSTTSARITVVNTAPAIVDSSIICAAIFR